MLGAANFNAGRVLGFASGNLCYQIEHHLFPDLPSNRYAEIAQRVRALCDEYDLPYVTGSFTRQYFSALRTIHRLALPDRFLGVTSNDAPETLPESTFGASTVGRRRRRRRNGAKGFALSTDSTSPAAARPAA
jgi:fatty acid desaturase